jgi:DNA-binding PadR family transcriptional regulator
MQDQGQLRHNRRREEQQGPGRPERVQRTRRFDGRRHGASSSEDQGPEAPAAALPDAERLERRHCARRHDSQGHEHPSEEQRSRHEHHRGERNFWREWRDERHHHIHGEDIPVGQSLSPKEMEAWREFFHQTFGTWPGEHWIFGGRRFSPWHQGMDTFNPFVATLLSKGGGLLPLYVLHLVSQQPRYGNEIMEQLAERTNGQWVANPGAIYPLLTLLEKEGFIEGKWEDPDKRTIRIYTITAKGQAEVSRIMMIVMPKIIETVQVLQKFIGDLQAEPATSGASTEQEADETGDPVRASQADEGEETL